MIFIQLLLHTCEVELRKLDLYINSAKSVCIRIGSRFCNNCRNLIAIDGHRLIWVDSIRYLGVYILPARSFQCFFDVAKKKFYSAFNAIYGRIGRFASEEVTLNLISAKCIPCFFLVCL